MKGATGVTITNPLVLYRALIATSRITPDPAQLRLALHLQKLYDRLKDYEPTIENSHKLNRLNRAIGKKNEEQVQSIGSRGLWRSLLAQKEKKDSLAMTRVLTSHEEALQLNTPKGLMLHGEVGTGKSMLIDLFADSLPNRRKRRWHFNTFMLETFSRLEQLRRNRLSRTVSTSLSADEYSLLWLARDLIKTSPILFLDEFQLPDRAASKIMSNLMTSFFQLGGVLIATSNRMPDELAKAAGTEFIQPSAGFRPFGWRFGPRDSWGKSGKLFGGQGEFAEFLELLKARCEVWEMEGGRDYRRSETNMRPLTEEQLDSDYSSFQTLAIGNLNDPGTALEEQDSSSVLPSLPSKYFTSPALTTTAEAIVGFERAQTKAIGVKFNIVDHISWKPAILKVYGRQVFIPRTYGEVASFTFAELCATTLGPADYISLASTFHTFIITDVPVLTVLLKNEARRFITLLDALYEARCKLLVQAAVGPDDLFFPETRQPDSTSKGEASSEISDQDAVYPETFSEAYQDTTAPFRPNASSYDSPDTTHARVQGILAEDALEDDPPNRARRLAGSSESSEIESLEVKRVPDFAQIGTFIGEDEKFAYKRAASRLWEMCGTKWWDRSEEGWWRPLPKEARRWEGSITSSENVDAQDAKNISLGSGEGMGGARDVDEKEDELMFKHGASPFRTHDEPPPRIGWTHIWGTTKWGKRAGAWGQGVEGLKDRKKDGDK